MWVTLQKFDFWGQLTDITFMIITNHRQKLLNAILYFARNTRYCGKTKLMKLLYFLDFYHFKQTAKSVTGLDYYAWRMGPVPTKLYEELTHGMNEDLKQFIHDLSKEGFQQIRPKRAFDNQIFSYRELKVLEDLSYIFKESKADAMIESTHLRNEPWDKTLKEKGEFQKIDYMLALDSDVVSLPQNEAKEQVEERSEMYKIFGAD